MFRNDLKNQFYNKLEFIGWARFIFRFNTFLQFTQKNEYEKQYYSYY